MDGYEVRIWYSADDACYVAQVVEFPGCAADGQSHEDALANLKALVPVWIGAMKSEGHPIPPPKHATLTAA